MSEQLFSDVWYRVAGLRPEIRSHAIIRPHEYRGRQFFVIEDRASGRVHRFTPIAHHFIAQMDGARTVDQIWEASEARYGDQSPTQDEVINLLSQLHGADLLQMDVPPDCRELFRRYEVKKARSNRQQWINPLAIRIPLLDIDVFLDRHVNKVGWLFSTSVFVIWLVTICTALLLAAANWSELTENVIDRVLTPKNLLLIWLIYPCIKLLHEFGHAFSAKRWGCEVHTLGILFLVMIPMPYVDATSSSGLPDRRQRAFVAAMGVMVELFIAALALFVWLTVEPGLVRAVAFNILLIGGVSTVLFNGNPLLKFDGYFVLSDLLGIANLGNRANEYIGYLVQRYLFGLSNLSSPSASMSEAAWLGAYSVLSFAYRMIVLFGIVILIAGKFFVVGVAIALWAITMQILWPIMRKASYLAQSPQLNRCRIRAIAVTLSLVLISALLMFEAPMPLRATTEGVVWASPEAELRADADAIVEKLIARPYTLVSIGEALLETSDPTLEARVDALKADLRGAKIRYRVALNKNQVEAESVREEIGSLEANLNYAQEQLNNLIIRSPADGVFLIERPDDLVGRYVTQGELLGFVADLSHGTVRIAVTQDDIGLIRSGTQNIEVRFADHLNDVYSARISRESPAATYYIPSPVLGTKGGGQLAIEPGDETGTKTLEKVFHLELLVDQQVDRLGQRAYVRFDLGSEAIGWQWYRRLRQLLLRQLDA